jgi:hypothetical protein
MLLGRVVRLLGYGLDRVPGGCDSGAAGGDTQGIAEAA